MVVLLVHLLFLVFFFCLFCATIFFVLKLDTAKWIEFEIGKRVFEVLC